MDKKLIDFLTELAVDPQKLSEFMLYPDKSMQSAELEESDREILKSGDVNRIHAKLMGKEIASEMPPVVVVTAESLTRGLIEYSKQLQQQTSSYAGLTLFPNIPPQIMPMVTPQITPMVTPQITPMVTPQITPMVTPQITPMVTPQITPMVTPQITPMVTPQIMPMVTPQITPMVTPQITPMITPQITRW